MDTHRLPHHSDFIAPGEPQDSAYWRSGIINRVRWFADPIWRYWFFRYERHGYVKANLWLVGMNDRLKLVNTGMFVDATDSEIANYAKVKTRVIAAETRDAGRRLDKRTAVWTVKTLFERTGLDFPLDDQYWKTHYDSQKVVAAMARIEDPRWLARQLRVRATRQLEQIARELGLVTRKSSPYASDFTLSRYFARQKANERLLSKLVATNDLGQEYTLAELSKLGVSNPVNRRNELMSRLSGFEDWAASDEREWTAVFYTITTPSKYHPTTVRGGKIRRNLKYNGATPREAQTYLNTLWQRARAEAKRQGIEYFGFRVAEPHHDGTPHWHLLLFVLEDHQQAMTRILKDYAMSEDPDEPGAQQHRFEAVTIDPTKGRATGYLAKYISKNVDGYQVETDEEAQQPTTIGALRAVCWASVWGIRQFQQIGGPPVTVWRELRRVDQDAIDTEPESTSETEATRAQIQAIHQAADNGDWKVYVQKMGGATVKRAELPLRAMYFITPESGRYGEDLSRLFGLVASPGIQIETRPRIWTIKLPDPARNLARLTVSRERAADAPRGKQRDGPAADSSAALEFCQ